MTREHTIAAIATGTGGGVGIVRVSGPGAEQVLRRIAPGLRAELASHVLVVATVSDPATGEALDEALVCLMRGPRSYTGEDVAEVHAHGGAHNLARILDAAVRAGARVAEPGEFTRRAFLSGRMDLAQAEAVAELIGARSSRAVRVAQAQRAGAVSREVAAARAEVVSVIAELEGAIDFPDEGLSVESGRALAGRVAAARARVAALGDTYRRGRFVQGGVDVALCGRPNAGKSTLLNALLGEERALVDPEAGTTRDYLEAVTEMGGVRVTLVDSAGEREAEDPLEQRGVALGRARRSRADLVVIVVDATRGFGAVEQRLLDEAPQARRLIAWNKRDAGPAPAGVPADVPIVEIAATTGLGLATLRGRIVALAGDEAEDGAALVTSARQVAALAEAREALGVALERLGRGEPEELVVVELRAGLERLGAVMGEGVGGDVLDAIFARFCVGK